MARRPKLSIPLEMMLIACLEPKKRCLIENVDTGGDCQRNVRMFAVAVTRVLGKVLINQPHRLLCIGATCDHDTWQEYFNLGKIRPGHYRNPELAVITRRDRVDKTLIRKARPRHSICVRRSSASRDLERSKTMTMLISVRCLPAAKAGLAGARPNMTMNTRIPRHPDYRGDGVC